MFEHGRNLLRLWWKNRVIGGPALDERTEGIAAAGVRTTRKCFGDCCETEVPPSAHPAPELSHLPTCEPPSFTKCRSKNQRTPAIRYPQHVSPKKSVTERHRERPTAPYFTFRRATSRTRRLFDTAPGVSASRTISACSC